MTNTAPILFVNDDAAGTAQAMRATLTGLGHYSVIEARTTAQALAFMRRRRPGLMLLELNRPGPDGREICRAIREASDLPIIVLSVRGDARDEVETLDAGADDYITKPCSIHELLARIRAAMRRTQPVKTDPPSFVIGDLEIDFVRRRAVVAGRSIRLTPREYDVLQFLVSHLGKPISHRRLLQAVWGPDFGAETERLRTTISNLRKKIEIEPPKPKYLLTQAWVGYCFTAAPAGERFAESAAA